MVAGLLGRHRRVAADHQVPAGETLGSHLGQVLLSKEGESPVPRLDEGADLDASEGGDEAQAEFLKALRLRSEYR